jgi:hypothetical protein
LLGTFAILTRSVVLDAGFTALGAVFSANFGANVVPIKTAKWCFFVRLPAPPCILGLRQWSLYSCGLKRFLDGARYRVRTCDPYRVKVLRKIRVTADTPDGSTGVIPMTCFSNSLPAQALALLVEE